MGRLDNSWAGYASPSSYIELVIPWIENLISTSVPKAHVALRDLIEKDRDARYRDFSVSKY